MAGYLTEHPEGCVLHLRAVPNAARTALAGVRPSGETKGPGERLTLRLHAPPVDGKANREVARWAADFFGLPASAVRLLRGEKAREKDLLLQGLGPDRAAELVAAALPQD